MIPPFAPKSYVGDLKRIGYADQEVDIVEKLCAAAPVQRTPASTSIPTAFQTPKAPSRYTQCGSKLEYAYSLKLTSDPDVAGFLCGVVDFAIKWQDADGSVRGVRHSPDFVVFLAPGSGVKPGTPFVVFSEVKCHDALKAAYDKGSRRYLPQEDGAWSCPSAEAAAKEHFGAGYRVVTDRMLNPIAIQNYEYRQAYQRAGIKEVRADIRDAMHEAVSQKPGVGLPELLASVPGLSTDRFLKLLVDGHVFVREDQCRLDFVDDVQVFVDRATADVFAELVRPANAESLAIGRYPTLVPGERLLINGVPLVLKFRGRDLLVFEDEKGKPQELTVECFRRLQQQRQVTSLGVVTDQRQRAAEILARTSPAKLLAATQRYVEIKARVEGGDTRMSPPLTPRRRYWVRKARAALASTGMGVLGCIDGTDKRGCYTPRVSEQTEKLVQSVIAEDFAQPQAPKVVSSYAAYLKRCESEKVAPVSLKTFRKRVKSGRRAYLVAKREGHMAGAALEAPVDTQTLLEGGGRWFMHMAHADEFVVDLASVGLGQAWAVVLFDSYTRTVLAAIVTYEAPSYLTTMMLLRECVRRHGRLPEIFISDGGPGFRNLSLRLLLAYYGVTYMRHPKGKARWGAEIERFGGATNQRISNELPGSTKVLQKHRRVSETHDPARYACYVLEDIGRLMREWCYNIYDKLPHAGLFGKTPEGAREISKVEHGTREQLSIADDPNFWTLSLPAVDGDGTAKVQDHDGVQVGNVCYWHKAFNSNELIGKRVQVRWDPLNITHVWAFVEGAWVRCSAPKLASLERLTPEMLATVSLALRKGRQDYAKDYKQVLLRVRDFVDKWREDPSKKVEFEQMLESAREALRGGNWHQNSEGADGSTDEPGDSAAGENSSRPSRPVPGLPVVTADSQESFRDVEVAK